MKKQLTIFCLLIFLAAHAQTNYILRGNEFYKAGQYEQAEINYRKALEVDPENTIALHNLGNALYKQGKFEESVKINGTLTKSTKDKPARAAAFYNQGVSHTKLNHLEASIESYKNALKIDPKDQQARENLQKALLQLKKKQQQDQKKQQQSSSMSQKQADQKLKQLQQRERELQQKMNQKNQGGGGAQDW